MKRIVVFFSALFLLAASVSLAQRTVGQQNFIQLKINNVVTGIDNLAITDALGPDNKMMHAASFDITLNDQEATRNIMAALQGVSTNKKGLELSFITINSNMEVMEVKTYSYTTVQEINLPQLDATSRSLVKAMVKIKAGSVQIQRGAGDKSTASSQMKSRNAAASNFKCTLGSLPCNRISKVGAVSIRPGDGQLQNFTIEVMGADATAWNQWFLTGAGGIKKEQGSIELLTPDLKVVLYTIILNDAEIISFSTTAGNGQQTIARATIGLRAKNLVIK